MVLAGDYVVQNSTSLFSGLISRETGASLIFGLLNICVPLFIDWRILLQENKFRVNFRIWK